MKRIRTVLHPTDLSEGSAAAFAYASDVSPPEKRAGVLGLIGAAIGIGFTLGQPVGGLLAGKDAATANAAAGWVRLIVAL